MKTNLKSILVYVDDVAATSSFYQRALGLEQTMATEDGTYVQLNTGEVALAFASSAAIEHLGLPMQAPSMDVLAHATQFAFEAEDVSLAFQRFIDAGGIAVNEPVTRPWGQVVSHVRDINGFIVEIGSIQADEWGDDEQK
jgi:lactoylglutathione lyase